MKKYHPSRKALMFIRIIIFAAAVALTVLARTYLAPYKIIMWTAIGICWALVVCFGLILIPLYFRRTVYCISSAEISKHSGMIYLSRTVMKFSAVQYITEIVTPLSRITALNFIIINALGGKILIPFLSSSDCDEISSLVSSQLRKRDD